MCLYTCSRHTWPQAHHTRIHMFTRTQTHSCVHTHVPTHVVMHMHIHPHTYDHRDTSQIQRDICHSLVVTDTHHKYNDTCSETPHVHIHALIVTITHGHMYTHMITDVITPTTPRVGQRPRSLPYGHRRRGHTHTDTHRG